MSDIEIINEQYLHSEAFAYYLNGRIELGSDRRFTMVSVEGNLKRTTYGTGAVSGLASILIKAKDTVIFNAGSQQLWVVGENGGIFLEPNEEVGI
jgi:hypothetical protein